MSGRRILIVRLGALGDVCHALPALDALRRGLPRAFIGWVVEPPQDDLLAAHPALDEVIPFPRRSLVREFLGGGIAGAGRRFLRFARALRARRYQVALDLQGNLRSAAVTLLSGAPVRLGFAGRASREPTHLAYTRRIRVPARSHKVDRFLAMARALGVATEGARPFVPPPADAARALALLDGLRDARGPVPRVAIHAGMSGFGHIKAWSREAWSGLARGLLGAGAQVLLIAGPSDEAEAERIRAEAATTDGVRPSVVRGLGIRELADLFRRVDLVIGLDSGPLHLAAAVGARVLGIYGPKDPAVYGPYGPLGRVVRTDAPVPCMPCNLHRCPIDRRCMTSLGPERVLDAALAHAGIGPRVPCEAGSGRPGGG